MYCRCPACRDAALCASGTAHISIAAQPLFDLISAADSEVLLHPVCCAGAMGHVNRLRCKRCHSPVASVPHATAGETTGWLFLSAVKSQLPLKLGGLHAQLSWGPGARRSGTDSTSQHEATLSKLPSTKFVCACACGQCKFTTEMGPREIQLNHCYCSICRKLSGAPYFTWTPVRRSALHWERNGQQLLDSSATSHRTMCGQCGGSLTMTYSAQPDTVWIAAGCIKNLPPPAYAAHIFCDDAAPWYLPPSDGLPHINGIDHPLAVRLSRGDYTAPMQRSTASNTSMEATVMDAIVDAAGSEAAAIVGDTPLMDAGVDSLGATAVASKLRSETGLPVSPMLLFEHPTVRAISAHLLRLATGSSSPVTSHPPEPLQPRDPLRPSTTLVAASSARPQEYGPSAATSAPHRLLSAGVNAVSEVPATRWTYSKLPAVEAPLAARIRHGGFICNAQLFDNLRFGISSVESAAMDPQQRRLLEHVSIAAAPFLSQDEELPVAVCVGMSSTDFGEVVAASPQARTVYSGTGVSLAVAAGRLSFALGLQVSHCCHFSWLLDEPGSRLSAVAVRVAGAELNNRHSLLFFFGGNPCRTMDRNAAGERERYCCRH